MESEVVHKTQTSSLQNKKADDYNLYVLSLDPGAINTGWSLMAVDSETKQALYVNSGTDKFSRFGNNDNTTTAQIAQDADMFVKKMEREVLKAVPSTALVIVLIENQYVNPSAKFRAGLNLRAMEVALMTAFTVLFRGLAQGGRAGICQTVMPRTVNSVMKIEGSKTTNPNFKWQHLIDSISLMNVDGTEVDLSKISKHEADTVWQALWYAKAYLAIDPPFKLSKIKQETTKTDVPKKRSRKIAAKGPQAIVSGLDGRNNGQGLEGTAASNGDFRY